MIMAYNYANLNGYERVKDNSVLDGDKIILGINTFWSTLLPVTKYPSICFGTACISAMQNTQLHDTTCNLDIHGVLNLVYRW